MAIPYPVHIGRLRCIVTGCAGRSRYCEFLHTDTHTSITEHWCARARSLPYSPHTLSPLSSATWHARITARAARSQPGRPSHSTLSSLSSAMRHAHTHQCARALLLGLLVDLCYLYAIDHIKTNQANPEPCSPTLTCCSHSLTYGKNQKAKPPNDEET